QITVMRVARSTTKDRGAREYTMFTCVLVGFATRDGHHRLSAHCFGIVNLGPEVVPTDLLDGLVRGVLDDVLRRQPDATSMNGVEGNVNKERFADGVAGRGRYRWDIHRCRF